MADLIDREEAKKAMTAAVWERAALADASPLQAQLAVRAYSEVLDDLPAASQIVEHEYTPSMNPNNQGECIVCGGGPHTRVCDPRDEVILGLLEALEVVVKDVAESRAALRPHVIAKVQDILDEARKLMGEGNG